MHGNLFAEMVGMFFRGVELKRGARASRGNRISVTLLRSSDGDERGGK